MDNKQSKYINYTYNNNQSTIRLSYHEVYEREEERNIQGDNVINTIITATKAFNKCINKYVWITDDAINLSICCNVQEHRNGKGYFIHCVTVLRKGETIKSKAGDIRLYTRFYK